MNLLSENVRFVQGIAPVADFAPGAATYTDVINCKGCSQVTFIVQRGIASDAAIHTITVEACDNTTPDNVSAIAFNHKTITAADVEGALTAATTAGYSSTSVTNQMEIIEVNVDELTASGYGYVRLKLNETHDHAVTGGVLVALSQLRYGGDQKTSPIT